MITLFLHTSPPHPRLLSTVPLPMQSVLPSQVGRVDHRMDSSTESIWSSRAHHCLSTGRPHTFELPWLPGRKCVCKGAQCPAPGRTKCLSCGAVPHPRTAQCLHSSPNVQHWHAALAWQQQQQQKLVCGPLLMNAVPCDRSLMPPPTAPWNL